MSDTIYRTGCPISFIKHIPAHCSEAFLGITMPRSPPVPDLIIDPVLFCKMCWPHITLYDKQQEILYSVKDNEETYVPAGNDLGKDFVSALCALWFFVSRRPARVVTTSIKYDQLNDVLWGEIRRFVDTSVVELPIQCNHLYIRQLRNDGTFEPACELTGQVVNVQEGLLGRHCPRTGTNGDLMDMPRTLLIGDEGSGIARSVYESASTWTHRQLWIGNCYPCENHFKEGIEGGNVVSPIEGEGLFRNNIKIKAEDSPNVQFALGEIKAGKKPSHKIVIPGVLDYRTYVTRRAMWDSVRQCVGLDAEFYQGAEVLLFPPDWLNYAETYADSLPEKRPGISIGVDPAEGGDKSAWSVIDAKGLIKQVSRKTPNTTDIPKQTLALMQEYSVPAENVVFDQGGGGKQHVDVLREQGHNVRAVPFGAAVTDPSRYSKGINSKQHRINIEEVKYAFKNRRAEMYGLASQLVEPVIEEGVVTASFGMPSKYSDLRSQLSVIPKMYDVEGRLELPPKNKRNKDSKEVTLVDLIGHSPDEADSFVLAVYGMLVRPKRSKVRAF